MMVLLLNANDSVGRTYSITKPSPLHPVAVEGVGVRTGNLFTEVFPTTPTTSNQYIAIYVGNGTFTLSTSTPKYNGQWCSLFFLAGNVDSGGSSSTNGVALNEPRTVTAIDGYVTIGYRKYTDIDMGWVMLNTGSTAQPYEPYGYKIPVNVKSENLLDADTVYSAYKQIDGTFQGAVNNFYTTHPTPFTTSDIGKTFTFSIKVNATTSVNVRASANVGGVSVNGNNLSSPGTTKVTFTVASTNDYLYLGYGSGGGNQITLSDIMLNAGTTPLPYQPYSNTTTNIYLGSATSTRRVKKLVLTGQEDWLLHTSYANLFRLNTITDYLFALQNITICNAYEGIINGGAANVGDKQTGFYYTSGASIRTLYIKDTNYSTAADFKAFLAQQYANGTPVTIWYVLATPETAAVNEPLMKIGTYADEITKTGTGVDIPTLNGVTVYDCDLEVKPSKMYVKYRKHGT